MIVMKLFNLGGNVKRKASNLKFNLVTVLWTEPIAGLLPNNDKIKYKSIAICGIWTKHFAYEAIISVIPLTEEEFKYWKGDKIDERI